MAYDNIISRDDAADLIPEEEAGEIIKLVPSSSAVLAAFKNVPMSRKVKNQPVLSSLATAGFVNGDTGLKPTTEINWDGVQLVAEPIAAIVPLSEDVLEDSAFDIIGEARPEIAAAIGAALDAAVLFGTNKPASWPTAIGPAAVAASQVIARGTNAASAGGLAADISDLMSLVEDDGFDVSAFVANRTLRGKLRKARDTSGQKLADVSTNEIEGVTVQYGAKGLWPSGLSAIELFAGDADMAVIGVRSDIKYKLITEGAIFDDNGDLMYNLPQQDMVALRVVARFAFAVANPVTRENSNSGTRYPFAVLRSPAS